jgi:hypothetical protein
VRLRQDDYFFVEMPTFVRLQQDRLFLCRDANLRAPAARSFIL